MAKLKVMSIELAAPKSRKNEVLDYLQKRGAVELTTPGENETLNFRSYAAENGETGKKLSEISSAGEILRKTCMIKKPLTAMLEPRKDMSAAQFALMSEEVEHTYAECLEILALSRKKAECSAEIIRCETLKEAFMPWKNFSLPLKAGYTGKTAFVPGSFRGRVTEETILSALAAGIPEIDCVETKIISSDDESTCMVFFTLKQYVEEVENILRGIGFQRAPECENTPAEEIENLGKKAEAYKKEIVSCDEAIKAKAQLTEKIEFAEDFLSIAEDKFSAMEKIPETKRVFYVKGYIAEKDGKKISAYLEKHFDAAVSISEPAEDEDVPVILSNNFFAAPLENITGMYSMPGKFDPDPTGVMAFFYYCFFGMMLSDAGYGLMMVIATGGILLFKKNLERPMKNTLLMYLFCGISTVFWGAMYGSWFGDMINIVRTEFMGLEEINLAIWLDPIDDLMKLLVYCFIFGLVHLFVGVGVKGVSEWKNGHKADALMDTLPTYITVLGVAPIFFNLFLEEDKKFGPEVTAITNIVLIVGVIMIILTAGRSSKSIGGKLGLGLYEVYNTFGGYLGDVLSYARLLALGLSTGVIASVINMLGTLPENRILKLVLFIVVSIVGHIANFGINIIGAYVHTNRLQYVEFFGKFYEGGGRAFVPFNAKTEYYKFKEEN